MADKIVDLGSKSTMSNSKRMGPRVNVLDIMILALFALIGIAALYFLLTPTQFEDVPVIMVAYGTAPGVYENLNIGDRVIVSDDREVGVLKDFHRTPVAGGYDLVLYMDVSAKKKDNRLYILNREISVGSRHDLKIGNAVFREIEAASVGREYSQTDIEIIVRFSEAEEWMAETISVGDAEIGPSGSIISRIKSVEKRQSPMLVVSDAGEVFLRQNPMLYEIDVTFHVNAFDHSGLYLHKNTPIRSGNSFSFINEMYQISGKVISIETG